MPEDKRDQELRIREILERKQAERDRKNHEEELTRRRFYEILEWVCRPIKKDVK